jgi:hypothetical protein
MTKMPRNLYLMILDLRILDFAVVVFIRRKSPEPAYRHIDLYMGAAPRRSFSYNEKRTADLTPRDQAWDDREALILNFKQVMRLS